MLTCSCQLPTILICIYDDVPHPCRGEFMMIRVHQCSGKPKLTLYFIRYIRCVEDVAYVLNRDDSRFDVWFVLM